MAPEETLADWLRGARRVLAFCGAGVSAESGLPTFRGRGGLWEGHRVEEVATPAAFQRDPALVWRFYAERQAALAGVQPNAAHRVLAAMERRYDDFLLVTQNVDDLHERAGSRKLLKLHGSLRETRCTACGAVAAVTEPVSPERVGAGELPRCGCGGLLRPNVVWFGELLNPLHFPRIERFLKGGAPGETVALIIGTSGVVSGGYGITSLADRFDVKLAEINPEPTVLSGEVDLIVRAPAGALLERVWQAASG
jgi:NAD-dependent SIR2 family protein deacetylase